MSGLLGMTVARFHLRPSIYGWINNTLR